MKKVGIVACSNALKPEDRKEVQKLLSLLENTGRQPQLSSCIFSGDGPLAGTGRQRAEELMKLFSDPEIGEIYDISGGDLANEVLDFLDFEDIARSRAQLWGYSDLTSVINAIYARTGKSSVLYSVRNLLYSEERRQQYCREPEKLLAPSFRMLRGTSMEGIVAGGNVRCLLKLAGTPYFPDMEGKLLLMEARSGKVPQMIAYLSQLRSCGVFEKINGILLGTFTQMEAEGCRPDMGTLVKSFAGPELPIAVTEEIGHGRNSRGIRIGQWMRISSESESACG